MAVLASRLRLPFLLPLLVAVLLELALHRAALGLLKPQVLEPESDLFRLFNGGVGPLFLFFASFVALVACTWILVVVVRHERLFAVPWRVVLGLFACVFLPVCAVGVFVSQASTRPLSHALRELHPYLNLFFAPMLGAVVAALWSRRGLLSAKIGVTLLSVPLLAFAYFSYRTAAALGQDPGATPIFEQLRQVSVIPRWFRSLWLYSGPLVFLAFMPLVDLVERSTVPRPDGFVGRFLGGLQVYGQAFLKPKPLVVGLGAGVILGVGIRIDCTPLRSMVDAALATDLPSPSATALLFLASLSLFFWTVTALASRPGPTRLVAAGLLLLGIAGLRLAEPLHSQQLTEPLYYLLATVGLLSLTVGIAGAWDRAAERHLAALSPVIPEERWSAFLRSVAVAFDTDTQGFRGEATARSGEGLGASEPDHEEETRPRGMVIRRLVEEQSELSGIQGLWRGLPLSFTLHRTEGRVEALTLVIGEALSQSPDWVARCAPAVRPHSGTGTLFSAASTSAASSLTATSPASPGSMAHRRDPLILRGPDDLTDRLLSDDLALRLAELVDGEVAVWRHLGVRYRYQADHAEILARLLPVTVPPAHPGEAPPPPSRLLALCDLLHSLALRAGVTSKARE